MAETEKKPTMSVKCPKCGTAFKFYMPDTPGVVKKRCPNPDCGAPIGIPISEKQIQMAFGTGAQEQKTETANASKSQQQSEPKGHPVTDAVINNVSTPSVSILKLVKKRKRFYQKDVTYDLHAGKNTIGMFDPADPSDIMIEGDLTISHRSVTIEVTQVGSSYKYLFTVNKSLNPVYIEGKEIPVGTSIYIDANKEFILGTSKFILSNK